jgi:hypothetical protein
MRASSTRLIVTLFTSCLAPFLAAAAPITVQGALRVGALPAPDGTYGVVFALYSGETGGSPVWSESVPSLAVSDGLFATELGKAGGAPPDPSLFASGQAAWFGVKVGGEPELPRRPLGSVPYAVAAELASDLACTGCVEPGALASNTPFAVIKVGSDAITLTKANPNLTFAATGGASVGLDPTTGVVTIGAEVFDPATLTAQDIAVSVPGLPSNLGDALAELAVRNGNPTVGWGASHPVPGADSGEGPSNLWVYTGKRTRFIKRRTDTLLKITLSDTLRINGTAKWARLEVRINGASVGCWADQYVHTLGSSNNDWHVPHSNVCMLGANTVGAGAHEAELWMYSNVGNGYEGWSTHELVLVEELEPSDRRVYQTFTTVSGEMSGAWAPVPGRQLDYTKKEDGTTLRLTIADTFRVAANLNAVWQYLEVRMDGAMMPQRCYFGRYDHVGGATGVDFHHPFVTQCIVTGVSKGNHTFSLWRSAEGGGTAYVGWQRASALMMVEELNEATSGLVYSTAGVAAGEYASTEWAQANGRQVQFTATSNAQVFKVSYSDTIRGSYFCNGGQAFVQLELDGQPTHCIRGVHHATDIGTGQDHHMPFHHTCLLGNLSPGSHTLTVHQRIGVCGSMYLGVNRSYPLLQVEPLAIP